MEAEQRIAGGFSDARGICAADLTGSGVQDLIVSDTAIGVDGFEIDGDGGFARHTSRARLIDRQGDDDTWSPHGAATRPEPP